jgi:hypothetical protein
MKRLFSILLGGLLLSATLAASAAGDRTPSSTSPPIITWQAPAFYTSPSSGRKALTDAAAPMPYIALVPCREYDSRNATPLLQATPRTVTLSAVTAPPCGVPTTAVAVAVNITIFNIFGASGNGVFKVDTVTPPLTAWINYPSTETQRGNAGVLSTTGAAAIVVAVYQSGGSVDFTVDVFGYYGSTPANTANTFTVILPNATTAILGESLGGGVGVYGLAVGSGGKGVYGTNGTATGFGVQGVNSAGVGVRGDSTSNVGVFGISGSATGFGVQGVNSAGVGVRGDSTSNVGVFGISGTATGFGVQGVNSAGVGVRGDSTSNVGVFGISGTYNGVWAESATWDALYAQGGINGVYSVGARNGVVGITTAITGDNHGVVGYDSTGSPSASNYAVNSGGLFFSSTGFGVWGASRDTGVYGTLYDGSGAYVAGGLLGTTFGTVPNYNLPPIPPVWTGPWAVFANGNFGATGAKHFVEPHPTDAAKVIVYSSLEGREVGTYFRGTASIVNHEAVIVIPEDFRTVTAEEGLTIQVTPIGAYSQVYVESKDLNQIVIRGSQDVPFDYMVNGVRRAFKNFEPVQGGYEFMPRSPSNRMPLYLTEEAKARLISNGTYNPDGTVNMSTAERLGWAQKWRDDEAKAKAPQQAAAAKAN